MQGLLSLVHCGSEDEVRTRYPLFGPWQLEAHEITGVLIELPWSPLVITKHH